MDRFAKIISTIGTSPIWILLWILMLGGIFQTSHGVSFSDSVGIFMLFIWTFVVGMYLRTQLDLDNKNRKFRTQFLLWMIAGWLFVGIVYWRNFSWFMQDALQIAIVTIVILVANNIFYRISFHVSISTSLLILVNHFSNWAFWPLFLVVPLIAWSRLYLKKHTLLQVIAGFLVPFIVYYALQYLALVN